MNEATQMRWIALGMFVAALLAGAAFVLTGLGLLLMLVTAALLVGAFMSFLLSFAA